MLLRSRVRLCDGSHDGRIALYVENAEHVESFKYHEGASEATLVDARMNWEDFTVDRFGSHRVFASGGVETRAVLERVWKAFKQGKLTPEDACGSGGRPTAQPLRR